MEMGCKSSTDKQGAEGDEASQQEEQSRHLDAPPPDAESAKVQKSIGGGARDYFYSVQDAHAIVDSVTAQGNQQTGNTTPAWSDPDFPQDSGSIHSDPGRSKVVDDEDQLERPWMRFHDTFAAGKKPKLFAQGVAASDIEQGSLGNCWFCAAVSAIANRPDKISRLIYPAHYNPVGIYAVSLWNGYEWIAMLVDDAFPVKGEGEYTALRFASGTDATELWFPLIEKTFAKLVGSYQFLRADNAGSSLLQPEGVSTTVPVSVMEMLTGGKGMFVNAGAVGPDHCAYQAYTDVTYQAYITEANGGDTEVWWRALKEHLEKNWAVSACCSPTAVGNLVQFHAYSVLSVYEGLDSQGTELQLVRCRNPWGSDGEWDGPFGDDDPVWAEDAELRAKCDMEKGPVNDGSFWMTKADFEANYDNVNLCSFPSDGLPHEAQVISSWDSARSSFAAMEDGELLLDKKQILLTANPGTELNVRLRLQDPRSRKNWHHFYVYRALPGGSLPGGVNQPIRYGAGEGMSCDGIFTGKVGMGEIVGQFKLPAGVSEVVIIPVASIPGLTDPDPNFTICVQSSEPVVSLVELAPVKPNAVVPEYTLPAQMSYAATTSPCFKVTISSAGAEGRSTAEEEAQNQLFMVSYKLLTPQQGGSGDAGEEEPTSSVKFLLFGGEDHTGAAHIHAYPRPEDQFWESELQDSLCDSAFTWQPTEGDEGKGPVAVLAPGVYTLWVTFRDVAEGHKFSLEFLSLGRNVSVENVQ